MERQYRDEKRECKECGKKINDKRQIKICKKCLKKKMKPLLTQINKHNGEKRIKEKWKQETKTIQYPATTKPEYDHIYLIPRTNRKCTTCKQYHYIDKNYYHEYKTNKPTKGIPIHKLEELINEYKKEKNKDIKQFLNKRFNIEYTQKDPIRLTQTTQTGAKK